MLTTEEKLTLWKGILEATGDEAEWASIAKLILVLDQQRGEKKNHNHKYF